MSSALWFRLPIPTWCPGQTKSNETYEEKPIKPNKTYHTKQNLSNQTGPTQFTNQNLPNQTCQTKPANHTEPNLPNQDYWSKQSTPGSVVPLAMFKEEFQSLSWHPPFSRFCSCLSLYLCLLCIIFALIIITKSIFSSNTTEIAVVFYHQDAAKTPGQGFDWPAGEGLQI